MKNNNLLDYRNKTSNDINLYYKKYILYKNKYLNLKNQIGGEYKFNIEEWKEIHNSGQNNCGIFISDKYPNYILKCGAKKDDRINIINSQYNLFPNVIDYSLINYKGVDKPFITMDKFDGSITDLFRTELTNHVLDKMNISEKDKIDLLYLFKIKEQYTSASNFFIHLTENVIKCIKDPTFDYEGKDIKRIEDAKKLLDTFNIKTYDMNIDLKLYNKFIDELFKIYDLYYPIIINEIIKIKLLLLSIGYNYNDNKYDNYGYILSEIPLSNDHRKENVPLILGKYLYVYFIDWDSGLNSNNDIENVINFIIINYNDGLNYSCNGQYNFNLVQDKKIVIYDEEYNNVTIAHKSLFKENIFDILLLKREYNLDKFKKSYKSIDEIALHINLDQTIINKINEIICTQLDSKKY